MKSDLESLWVFLTGLIALAAVPVGIAAGNDAGAELLPWWALPVAWLLGAAAGSVAAALAAAATMVVFGVSFSALALAVVGPPALMLEGARYTVQGMQALAKRVRSAVEAHRQAKRVRVTAVRRLSARANELWMAFHGGAPTPDSAGDRFHETHQSLKLLDAEIASLKKAERPLFGVLQSTPRFAAAEHAATDAETMVAGYLKEGRIEDALRAAERNRGPYGRAPESSSPSGMRARVDLDLPEPDADEADATSHDAKKARRRA